MPQIALSHRFRPWAHGALAVLALALVGCGQDAPQDDGTLRFGVSAPLTGDTAEYSKLWREGFDLALEDINANGGVNGRKVVLDWQDSQGDPKQAVSIAQRFVDDPRILAELGDFASPSSMAASPVYQRGGLVQYGFTNSHPEFTLSGDYMFSYAQPQGSPTRSLVRLALRHGKRLAFLYVNNDWGKSSASTFHAEAEERQVDVPVTETFVDSTTDFRPLLLKVRDAKADVMVVQAYYKSAALIVQQARQVGLKDLKIVWANYNAEFIDLAGEASEGVSVSVDFYAPDAGPRAEAFVERFRNRYGKNPDSFNLLSYDALSQLAWAAGQQPQPTRKSIRDALANGKQIPSLMHGPFAFNADRRLDLARPTRELIVHNGRYVPIESVADQPQQQ